MSKVLDKLTQIQELMCDVLIEGLQDTEELELASGEVKKLHTASPALLTVAQKMLKDNDITVQEDDDKMSDVKRAVEAKRKARASLPDHSTDLSEFDTH